MQRALPSGFTVATKSLERGEELPWHDHGKATLCVVFSGSVREEDRRGTRLRESGDLVFRPLPERHRNWLDHSPAQILTLEIDAPAMDPLFELGLPDSTFYTSSRRAVRLARLAQAELRREEAVEIELLGLAYELLSTVVRHRVSSSQRPPQWLLRVRRRLLEDLRATPTLEELARQGEVSPYRLSRAFRRHFGVSVAEFLRRARVQHAMELLAETEMPIVEVALDAGFYDQSHLTNVFKRHTGLTPAAFRRLGPRP